MSPWLCLALALFAQLLSAQEAPAGLVLDDECSAEECALSALQVRGRRQSTPAVDWNHLCSKAAAACNMLGGTLHKEHLHAGHGYSSSGKISVKVLRYVMAVSHSSWRAFAAEAKLQGDELTCSELCRSSGMLLFERGFSMPAGPDIGCYRTIHGKDNCSVDLSPKRMVQTFGSETAKLKEQHHLESKRGHPVMDTDLPMQDDELQHDFEEQVDYHVQEMALRVLYFFRVYPRALNTYHAASAETKPAADWQSQLAEFNLVSRIFLVNTLRCFRLHQTAEYLETWFGASAPTDGARNEVVRVLNSVLKIMVTAELVYNNSNCEPGVYAFVFPNGYQGTIDPNSSVPDIRSNPQGQPVVYVCPQMLKPPVFEAVQAFVHEASHHAVAYTQDVIDCSEVRYLWLQTSKLPTMGGFDCNHEDGGPPPFALGGKSCNVSGGDIYASMTLQPWASESKTATSMNQSLFYGVEVLRYSLDGKFVLCQVETMEDLMDGPDMMSLWGCNTVYGQEACAKLAKEDPSKARMNADNYGYYVMDAGSSDFLMLEDQFSS